MSRFTEDEMREIMRMPKWHPARFLALYGATPPEVRRTCECDEEKAKRELHELRQQFGGAL